MNIRLPDSLVIAKSSFFRRLFEKFERIRTGRFDPEAAAWLLLRRRMGCEE
jgi:hypothetical protein